MTFSIGNDDLDRAPALAPGDLVPCTKCGGEHRVVESGPATPGEFIPLDSLLRLGHRARKSEDADWTSPCQTCSDRGSVPGDFPHCGPHQWNDGGYICDVCGQKNHRLALTESDRGPGLWHSNGISSLCGPCSPDPAWPGAWQCYGAEMRRRTTLLSFTCGSETFLAGMNGKSVMK